VHVRDPLGHYLNPLTATDIESKFKLLITPALGQDRAAATFALAWRIKEPESFGPLPAALVPEMQ
jgi:hypothetical protein